jgi:hypothetical protein
VDNCLEKLLRDGIVVILIMYFVDTGKSKKKANRLDDKLLVENEKQCQQNIVMPSVAYKLPLVWIDLEMTGRHMLLNYK